MTTNLANEKLPANIRTPFLKLPQSIRTECVCTFAQAMSEIVGLSHCKLSTDDSETENLSTTLDLGSLKLFATHGSAIDIQAVPRGTSCFIFPLETIAAIHIDKNNYTLLRMQNMMYLPPKPWSIAVKSLHLSALVIAVETKTINGLLTSQSSSRPYAETIKTILETPFLLSAETRFGASFINSIHATLLFVESIMMQDNGSVQRLKMGELLLRQLIFLWNDTLQVEMHDKMCTLDFNHLVDWIRQHCCEPICLADLEALSGYTSRNLQRAFHKRFGCGPMQYLRKERLNIACHKLETSPPGTRITAIANACGYNDLSSFSRDFKQTFNVPPKDKLATLWQSVSRGDEKDIHGTIRAQKN